MRPAEARPAGDCPGSLPLALLPPGALWLRLVLAGSAAPSGAPGTAQVCARKQEGGHYWPPSGLGSPEEGRKLPRLARVKCDPDEPVPKSLPRGPRCPALHHAAPTSSHRRPPHPLSPSPGVPQLATQRHHPGTLRKHPSVPGAPSQNHDHPLSSTRARLQLAHLEVQRPPQHLTQPGSAGGTPRTALARGQSCSPCSLIQWMAPRFLLGANARPPKVVPGSSFLPLLSRTPGLHLSQSFLAHSEVSQPAMVSHLTWGSIHCFLKGSENKIFSALWATVCSKRCHGNGSGRVPIKLYFQKQAASP